MVLCMTLYHTITANAGVGSLRGDRQLASGRAVRAGRGAGVFVGHASDRSTHAVLLPSQHALYGVFSGFVWLLLRQAISWHFLGRSCGVSEQIVDNASIMAIYT